MHQWLSLLCVLATLASTVVGAADKTPSPQKLPARTGGNDDLDKVKKQPRPALGFTPQQEAAAIAFVHRHHPELAILLTHLKKAEAREYERAVAALFRASERLTQVQERNPEQYERDLKTWKLKSRIQLLVAQIRMAPEDETLRRNLKQALVEQFDLRIAGLAEERKRFAERLRKLDADINRMLKERDKQVERQLDLLLRDKKKRGAHDMTDIGKTPADGKPDNPPPHVPKTLEASQNSTDVFKPADLTSEPAP